MIRGVIMSIFAKALSLPSLISHRMGCFLGQEGRPVVQVVIGVTVALLVRLVFLPWMHPVDWDGFFYLFYARNILAGDFLRPAAGWSLPPFGYALAIASLSCVVPSLESAAVLVSLLAGVLLIVPIFLLGEAMGGYRVACFAVPLVAFNPWLVHYSLSVLTESLFTFLLAWLVWLWLLDYRDQRFKGHGVMLAVVSGALVFVRPLGLVAVAGGILIQAFRPSPLPRRRPWAKLAKYSILTAVIAIAFICHARAVTKHMEHLTGQPQGFYAIHAAEAGLSGYYGNLPPYRPSMSPLTYLRANIWLLARPYFTAFVDQLASGIAEENDHHRALMAYYLWPLAAVGVWLCASERWRLVPLIGLLPYFLAVPLFGPFGRYYVPLLPFFLLYAAVGLAALIEGLRQRTAVVTVAAILLITLVHTYEFNPHRRVNMGAYEEVGRWLGRHEHPDVVIADHPAPAYYAQAQIRWLQDTWLNEELPPLEKFRGQRVYLVAAEGSALKPPPSTVLTPVYTSHSSVSARMIAYRVEPRGQTVSP